MMYTEDHGYENFDDFLSIIKEVSKLTHAHYSRWQNQKFI